MVGQRLGRYQITSQIGAGGMGQVYRAHDPHLERDVAIKIVNPALTRDRSAVDRFVREARAISRLSHPNIVTIHDVGETEGGRFIVTELVEGQTLRDVAKSGIEWETTADLIRQVARALAAAHAAGIVHRDVKPENVMVRADGLVKVLDFGLARLVTGADGDAASATASGTAPGVLLGTLRYMAPEQVAGGHVEFAADVFSLGLVLYELLTGRHPFGSERGWGVLDAIARQPVVPPSRLEPALPAGIDDLLTGMLEKDPRRRPAASDVVERLGGVSHRAPDLPSGPPQLRSVPPAPIGRGAELTMLRAAFDAAASGAGLIVAVSGEPGIGKTTLVESFLAGLEHDALACIARGRCSERRRTCRGWKCSMTWSTAHRVPSWLACFSTRRQAGTPRWPYRGQATGRRRLRVPPRRSASSAKRRCSCRRPAVGARWWCPSMTCTGPMSRRWTCWPIWARDCRPPGCW
jgi:hypothetical protein